MDMLRKTVVWKRTLYTDVKMENDQSEDKEEDGVKMGLEINEAVRIIEDGHRWHKVLLTAKAPTLLDDGTRRRDGIGHVSGGVESPATSLNIALLVLRTNGLL